MNNVQEYFKVNVSKDKMQATIFQVSKLEEDEEVTEEAIKQLLQDAKVVYGINEQAVREIVKSNGINGRTVIAEGTEPVHGVDAYLEPVITTEKGSDQEEEIEGIVDFKTGIEIPTVRSGVKVARKVAAKPGRSGKNVLGQEVKAKPGRDFPLRPGKNTRVDENEMALYATIDGQISFDNRTIHVMPTYEVDGDVSLKIGNISFIGNVVVRGNVPTGFEIHAEGDIRINGTVEGAKLISGGTIVITGGIVGQNRSYIEAAGDLQTNFINQGNVEVGGDLIVNQAILHSTCRANGDIICESGKGLIVGGSISAIKSIQANEIGNDMQTKTQLYIGSPEKDVVRKREIERDLKNEKDNIQKLGRLLKVYVEKEKEGTLENRDNLMKLRVQHSLQQSQQRITELEDELAIIEEEEELSLYAVGYIRTNRGLYPNVRVNFGKYRRHISAHFKETYISLIDREIVIETA